MPTLKPSQPAIPTVVPAGELRHLSPEEIKPSSNNPRHLFDEDQLLELKKNIAEHGVLVPITVYQARGQSKFSILDGERKRPRITISAIRRDYSVVSLVATC